MDYKFLLDASGTLISHFVIRAVREAGFRSVGSDISECAATYLADEFVIFPKFSNPKLWEIIENEIAGRGINVVIPTFDETLLKWAEKKQYFREKGVHVIVSDPASIAVCQDKWETFRFFKENGIPTPETSLQQDYPLVKPRLGRGGKGILINAPAGTDMTDMISQELLKGKEYTIDIFCDRDHNPVYIIPRLRMNVIDGKSVNGITVDNPAIISWVKTICSKLPFNGPVNMQCFESPEGEIKFTEINPRLGGGMALGFRASENWISLIVSNLIEGKPVQPAPVSFGLKMFRYYNEVFES